MNDTAQKLLRSIRKSGGCWNWTRGKSIGYGAIQVGGKTLRAHRVSYETFVGPIPAGMFVCHACDNRGCINPEHLFVGTAKDNVLDAYRKGIIRIPQVRPVGENNWAAKLNPLAVRTIRKSRKSQTELAKMYDVSQSTISDVVGRKIWAHV